MASFRLLLAATAILFAVSACSAGHYSNRIPGSYGTSYRSGGEALRNKDYAKAAEDYGFAAKSGHPRALIAYGTLFASGRGVERDPVRAAELLTEAHGKNSNVKGKAALALGRVLLDGGQGPSGELEADPVRARALLIEALEQGELRAASTLGRIYDEGLGVNRDVDEAIRYYELASLEDPRAAQRLAHLLVEVGAPQARIDDAADAVISQLEADAARGKGKALIQLADIFTRGEIVAPDTDRALGYLEKAAAQGDAAAYSRLAKLYAETDQPEREREALQKAADAGDARAQAKLAKLFLEAGTSETNGAAGRHYAEEAIGQGSEAAMVYLGLALVRGDVLAPEPEPGEALLRRASDAGYLRASTALGSSILKGEVAARYPGEGQKLLEGAAEKGSVAAMSALGFAYHKGRGVPEDEAAALYWLNRAAAAGHPTAQRFLAERQDGRES